MADGVVASGDLGEIGDNFLFAGTDFPEVISDSPQPGIDSLRAGATFFNSISTMDGITPIWFCLPANDHLDYGYCLIRRFNANSVAGPLGTLAE